MESVVGPALDEVKQSLSSALERRLKGQFEALEQREQTLNQREQKLKAQEKDLQDYAKQLQAREQALNERLQVVEQRELGTSVVNRCQQIVDDTPAAPSATLFNTPAQQPTAATKSSSLFPQRASEATANQKEQEQPKRISFKETAQKSEPSTQVSSSTSNRSPLFPQPAQSVTKAGQSAAPSPLFPQPAQQDAQSAAPSPLFPQPVQPLVPASQEVAAPQQALDGNPQAGPICRESCGSAIQLKSMFEQKVNSLKEEPVQKRKSWSSVQNQLTLPNGSDTGSFKAHDQGYKSRTSFDKPVREKRNLSDLLEKGP